MKTNVEKIDILPPVILVGNPNVGKSALFGALSGRYVEVSNYPGTTVDFSAGWIQADGIKRRIYDSPGADSLLPVSADEIVTRDLILSNPESPIILVADSRNLQRGLVLLAQLAEFNRKLILVLNMWDEALAGGIQIDYIALSRKLGIPVIPTIAIQNKGVEELKRALGNAAVPSINVDYGETVEQALARLGEVFPVPRKLARGLLIGFLVVGNFPASAGVSFDDAGSLEIDKIRNSVSSRIAEPLGFYIAKIRNDRFRDFTKGILTVKKSSGRGLLDYAGRISHHPVFGIPVLIAVLIGVYYFVGVFGAQTLVELIEGGLFGKYINPFFTFIFDKIPVAFIRDLFVGEYGILTMAVTYALALIFPIVTTFFIAFGILEDSGYLPRLAFMVDRIFKKIGLNGRAVLPMILGLGCDTMAVLSTRILNTKKEKTIVTFLLALAVPCSAQLGVTLGILGAISGWAVIIWLGVVLLVLFLIGFLASKVIPGRSSDFILEIPPLRLPKAKNVIVKTMMRLEWYLREAVPLFILGTLILFLLDKAGLLVSIERIFAPIVTSVLGLPERATDAFILGFLRRDYGAAGFKMLYDKSLIDPIGAIVAMTTITLFVPCIANFFIIIKERGFKQAMGMVAFIIPFAIMVGGLLNQLLRGVGIWW